MPQSDYILRSRDESERKRLAEQHEVWRGETDAILRAAAFAKGDRLLDLGCGPGYLTADLAEIVGTKGWVVGVDTSERFVQAARDLHQERGLQQTRFEIGEAGSFTLEPNSFDGAVCRWVLMFISDTRSVIRNVRRALKPGGRFAVMEYFCFQSISLWPEGHSFRTVFDAVYRLIGSGGGDADIGARLPALLSDEGFEIESLMPFLRVGQPGSPLWQWLGEVGQNHPNLVDAALLGEDELADYYREWDNHSAITGAFFAAPPVLGIVARRL
jgi:ubiquinone/menaquinone biosynthesis C-methylase UbiE